MSYLDRYVRPLEEAHDAEHLALFEELLEAAVDLDRIPDEYLIAASYDPELGDLAAAKADAEAAIDRAAQGVEREELISGLRVHWHLLGALALWGDPRCVCRACHARSCFTETIGHLAADPAAVSNTCHSKFPTSPAQDQSPACQNPDNCASQGTWAWSWARR